MLSAIAWGGKRYWSKVFREASVLPITFRGGGSSGGVGSGGDGVGGGVTGVTGDVGGSVGGKCGGARLAHRYLATRPGTPCFDSFASSVVVRVLLFKVVQYMLGAVSGP